jgi:hypothetical protein
MIELKQHRALTPEKWNTHPFSRQLLMIANELNRAQHWIEQGDRQEVQQCYIRAYELLYLTVEVLQDKRYLRELLRGREVLGALYSAETPDADENKQLMKQVIALHKDSFSMLAQSDK